VVAAVVAITTEDRGAREAVLAVVVWVGQVEQQFLLRRVSQDDYRVISGLLEVWQAVAVVVLVQQQQRKTERMLHAPTEVLVLLLLLLGHQFSTLAVAAAVVVLVVILEVFLAEQAVLVAVVQVATMREVVRLLLELQTLAAVVAEAEMLAELIWGAQAALV